MGNALGDRGSGITTRQILDAPANAVLIWAGARIYAEHLIRDLGRSDITVVGKDALRDMRLYGLRRPIIVDHFALASFTNEEFRAYLELMQRGLK